MALLEIVRGVPHYLEQLSAGLQAQLMICDNKHVGFLTWKAKFDKDLKKRLSKFDRAEFPADKRLKPKHGQFRNGHKYFASETTKESSVDDQSSTGLDNDDEDYMFLCDSDVEYHDYHPAEKDFKEALAAKKQKAIERVEKKRKQRKMVADARLARQKSRRPSTKALRRASKREKNRTVRGDYDHPKQRESRTRKTVEKRIFRKITNGEFQSAKLPTRTLAFLECRCKDKRLKNLSYAMVSNSNQLQSVEAHAILKSKEEETLRKYRNALLEQVGETENELDEAEKESTGKINELEKELCETSAEDVEKSDELRKRIQDVETEWAKKVEQLTTRKAELAKEHPLVTQQHLEVVRQGIDLRRKLKMLEELAERHKQEQTALVGNNLLYAHVQKISQFRAQARDRLKLYSTLEIYEHVENLKFMLSDARLNVMKEHRLEVKRLMEENEEKLALVARMDKMYLDLALEEVHKRFTYADLRYYMYEVFAKYVDAATDMVNEYRLYYTDESLLDATAGKTQEALNSNIEWQKFITELQCELPLKKQALSLLTREFSEKDTRRRRLERRCSQYPPARTFECPFGGTGNCKFCTLDERLRMYISDLQESMPPVVNAINWMHVQHKRPEEWIDKVVEKYKASKSRPKRIRKRRKAPKNQEPQPNKEESSNEVSSKEDSENQDS